MRVKLTVFVLAGVAALVLGASTVAQAAGGLAGTYTTTIKSPPNVKGKWALTFAKNGAWAVALNGQTLATGTYSATATTITLREPNGCRGTGTYAWKRSGKTMTFTRKREAPTCQIRAAVLSHRFTKVR
jgi:hypothetical protein